MSARLAGKPIFFCAGNAVKSESIRVWRVLRLESRTIKPCSESAILACKRGFWVRELRARRHCIAQQGCRTAAQRRSPMFPRLRQYLKRRAARSDYANVGNATVTLYLIGDSDHGDKRKRTNRYTLAYDLGKLLQVPGAVEQHGLGADEHIWQ